ncbi:MBL fold metallo-hydrolase [Granulosicoccus sp.]|nr:MBL fold metallo-hydrolase [Granulosicoccus sp.]MDB4223408.1 MBL fold metallo-hydrolase [Granulosicoccus sp.]
MYKIFRTTAAALAAVALLVGSISNSHAAGEGGDGVSTHEVAPGVFSFRSGSGYHSMFVITDEGVAAFETVNTAHSIDMVKAIRAVTDKPIKYALLSHNHWDHISGGAVMQAVGAKTVMHSLAADWLAANPGRDTTPPDMVWDGARSDIALGELTIQMHYLGLNHGAGMTVFVIPERRVAYIGDLVTPNRVMFSIVPDFNITEWERTLDEMMELDFDVAVCSHNDLPADEAIKGCTMDHVKEERAFISDLRNAIFAEFKKGTPPSKIPSVVELPQYAHWNHYKDWLPLNAQRMLLDLWMGPY